MIVVYFPNNLNKAIFAASLWALVAHAHAAMCCWKVGPEQLELSDQAILKGVVQTKKISDETLVIRTDTMGEMKLTFDRSDGSNEQKRLLRTLSTGDAVNLIYMKSRESFHINPIPKESEKKSEK